MVGGARDKDPIFDVVSAADAADAAADVRAWRTRHWLQQGAAVHHEHGGVYVNYTHYSSNPGAPRIGNMTLGLLHGVVTTTTTTTHRKRFKTEVGGGRERRQQKECAIDPFATVTAEPPREPVDAWVLTAAAH